MGTLNSSTTGFSNYEVTLDGDVINTKTGKYCKVTKNNYVILTKKKSYPAEQTRYYYDINYLRRDFVHYNRDVLYEMAINHYLNDEELTAMEKEVILFKWVINHLTKEEIKALNFTYEEMNHFYHEVTFCGTLNEEKKKEVLAKYLPKETTLHIDSDNGYLNLEDLPYNCIFNKVVTGCGGTTVVLFNNLNYVVCVPTTELIINKTGLLEAGKTTITNYDGKKQSVFGLFGEFTYQIKKQLKEYAETEGIKKIICTYDKLKTLDKYLDPSNFRLLIDEYHILLKAYSYRNNAIDGVLKSFKKYKSFCFMSATPISPDFTPAVLKDARLIEADWNETDTLYVKLDQTNNPYVKAANYINAYKRDGFININGNKSYEAFFFINSVTDIAAILQYCDLSNDEVKIVCADTPSNRKKLEGYTISNSRSENKKFTFITSKSFEGADYFSETALCFVVSNSRSKNTLLDISTDIYQIAGRIRTATNPFRGLLFHIFNSVGSRKLNLDLTYEDMVKKVNDNVNGANEIITLINNASDSAKEMAKKMLNTEYAIEEDGKYMLNDMIVKLDLYTYKVEKMIYESGIALRKEYNKNSILTTDIEYERIDEKINKVSKKITFKDAFLRYAELSKSFDLSTEKEELARIQPLIVPAYHKLGIDTVKSLRYTKKLVENALINLEDTKTTDNKIAKMITSKIKLGFITSKEAKEIINDAYTTTGIKAKAKATDLTRWFDCKEVRRNIDNKQVRGYEIYSAKFTFN